MGLPNVEDVISEVNAAEAPQAPEQQAPEHTPDMDAAAAGAAPAGQAPDQTPEQMAAQKQAEDIAELEKVIGEKKFKFEGRELTLTELKRAMLRQDDYTKKTQDLARQKKEMESVTERTKYIDNFKADLAAVRANPALAKEFKKIYPEHFHDAVTPYEEAYQKQMNTQPLTHDTVRQTAQDLVSERIEALIKEKLQPIEESLSARDRDVKTAEYANWDDEFMRKYDFGKNPDPKVSGVFQSMAYNFIEAAKREGTPLTKETWEQAYASAHEMAEAMANAKLSSQVQQKQKLNAAGRDTKPGGATPGQAPEKITLKNAADHVWRSMQASEGI